jgi:BASS family bile acid:Na+ symporter
LIAVAIPAMNFILLGTVGLALTPADFDRIRGEWVAVLFGLLAPLVILPPIALALTWLFQPDPEVMGSLLLLAACPIGGISNTYSYLARASTALSVTLTALSCLLASVTIPLLSEGFELALQQPFSFSAPLPLLIGQLVTVLGLPVAMGMWLRRRAPDLADRHARTLRRIAFVGTGFVLLLIVLEAPNAFLSGLSTTVPLAAAFVASSIVAGWLTSALVTEDRSNRFTIAAEFGTRNVAVAMAIAVTILGQVAFARFAVTYALVEIPLMLAAVALFRRYRTAADGALGDRRAPVRDGRTGRGPAIG